MRADGVEHAGPPGGLSVGRAPLLVLVALCPLPVGGEAVEDILPPMRRHLQRRDGIYLRVRIYEEDEEEEQLVLARRRICF